MPKINVYLPDDLAEQVRDAGLSVSAVCQVALAAALAEREGYEQCTDPRCHLRQSHWVSGDNVLVATIEPKGNVRGY